MSRRLVVIGSVDRTPGEMTYPSTLLTGADTFPGLTIEQHPDAPADQVAIRLRDSAAATIFEVPFTDLGPIAYGSKVGAASGVFVSPVCFNGTQNPPCLEWPNGPRWWSGTGVPAAGRVGDARVGDWYFDRTGAAGARAFMCSAAGNPGTWGAIA